MGAPVFYQKRLASLKKFSVICCDGGIRHAETLKIKPDVVIGDMDSATAGQLANYKSQGVKISQHPRNKDATDTRLALDYALKLDPEAIEIWGALGGRIDHALANLSLVSCGAKAGKNTRLVDDYCEIFIVHDEVCFTDATGQTVSIFAYPLWAKGLTLRGFQYSLDKESLEVDNSRGISNVIIALPAIISLEAGSLLVIRYWQKDIFPEAD